MCISSVRSLRHGVNSFSNFEGFFFFFFSCHLIYSDFDFNRGSALTGEKQGAQQAQSRAEKLLKSSLPLAVSAVEAWLGSGLHVPF